MGGDGEGEERSWRTLDRVRDVVGGVVDGIHFDGWLGCLFVCVVGSSS